MDLDLGQERARLSDSDLLGVGGEARVYRWRDLAVKVFHAPDARKVEKLKAFPRGLPDEVVGPLELATDRKGCVVGYAMKAISGAEDLLRLSQRKWREGVVSSEEVAGLFRNLHPVLGALHRRGVVIGDFNDSNVLFARRRPWLIDADSMQFAGLPCVVGHERFLDPRLYGADLSAAPVFTPGSDWYAFAVLLFGSLLYVHPYGGMHRKLPTQLRRAEARWSILRPDVQYPRAAMHFRVLPDDLLAWFEQVFDKDYRGELPVRLLEMSWTKCRCGVEHARASCPDCASLGAAALREATRCNGRCTARVVFRTGGRVLAAAIQGGLRYVHEEGGAVRREDGTSVMDGALAPGMRFAISGASTWVGLSGRLVRMVDGKPLERASTGTLGTSTIFDASSSTCYRTEQEWLVDSASGARIGKILEGQTWLRAGERLGFGLYRAGLLTVCFLFRHGRPGVVEVKLPQLPGRLVEASAVFDDDHVLFSCAVEKDGRRVAATYLIGADGRLIAEASGSPADVRLLASVHGKALLGGRMVCATDEGLLSLKAESGRIVEGTLFTDTQPFVGAGSELLPGPGGSIYVVSTKEIVQLTLA